MGLPIMFVASLHFGLAAWEAGQVEVSNEGRATGLRTGGGVGYGSVGVELGTCGWGVLGLAVAWLGKQAKMAQRRWVFGKPFY